MREFRRISFESNELANALFQWGQISRNDAEKFGFDFIQSKRDDDKFSFEFFDDEDERSLEAKIEISCETVLEALIEHSIRAHIPIPRSATKYVRLISDKLCIDMFLDTDVPLQEIPTAREFRRIIFSYAELKSAMEGVSSRVCRLLSHSDITGVKARETTNGILFELELFDFNSHKMQTLEIDDADALSALLGYTMEMGAMLPQRANKHAVEFQGHLNMEITM